MKLPHKAPILFAKKVLNFDESKALVALEFDSPPTLAMTVEAAAQAFSFIRLKNSGSWGVIAMIKDVVLSQQPTQNSYVCDVSIGQALDPYYKVIFKIFSYDKTPIASGELSIKIF